MSGSVYKIKNELKIVLTINQTETILRGNLGTVKLTKIGYGNDHEIFFLEKSIGGNNFMWTLLPDSNLSHQLILVQTKAYLAFSTPIIFTYVYICNPIPLF